MGPDGCWHMQWVAFQKRIFELRKLRSFILDSKDACPLFWWEILSLSSKAVCYKNLLEKTFHSKGQSVSLLMQKCERHTENSAKPTVAFIKASTLR